MSSQEVIVTRGIPGAGKTTWAVKWVDADENRARINRDDLRLSIFNKTWLAPEDEAVLDRIELHLLTRLLGAGKSVVLDATGLNEGRIEGYRQMVYPFGLELKHCDFPISLDLALERNEKRVVPVPENIVRGMHDKVKDGFPEF